MKRSIVETHPHIAAEWDYEKNGSLLPSDVSRVIKYLKRGGAPRGALSLCVSGSQFPSAVAKSKNACRYLENDEKAICSGGSGVNCFDLDETYTQMVRVRKYYGKVSGNPLIHFIVSFDETVQDAQTAGHYARQLVTYFVGHYQVLWCVHHKPHGNSLYHVHIVINSVSIEDGRMFHSSPMELNHFCAFVAGLLPSNTRWFFKT